MTRPPRRQKSPDSTYWRVSSEVKMNAQRIREGHVHLGWPALVAGPGDGVDRLRAERVERARRRFRRDADRASQWAFEAAKRGRPVRFCRARTRGVVASLLLPGARGGVGLVAGVVTTPAPITAPGGANATASRRVGSRSIRPDPADSHSGWRRRSRAPMTALHFAEADTVVRHSSRMTAPLYGSS
jgi:hypothetical protein